MFKCIKGLCAHQPLLECVWTDEISVRRYWCDVGLSITSSVYTIPCQDLMNIQLTLCQLVLNVLHVRVLYITLSCYFLFLVLPLLPFLVDHLLWLYSSSTTPVLSHLYLPYSPPPFSCVLSPRLVLCPHPPLPFSPIPPPPIPLPLSSLLCRMSPCRTWPQCWPEQATWRMPQN